MLVNKFYAFTAACFVQAAGAPVYTFSIYAPALASQLGLGQAQLETVGSLLSLGNFLALLSGSAYDALDRRHPVMGPRMTVWVGCVLGAIGYGGLYAAASGALDVSYGQLLGLAFVAGNASSWYDTATVVTCVRNFPNARGSVVGLLKSFVGLSGSLYSSVYAALLPPGDPAGFLGLLALSVPLVPLLASAALNHVPYVERSEVVALGSWFSPETRFLLATMTVAALALYQMSAALLQSLLGPSLPPGPGYTRVISAGTFAILSLMLLVPWQLPPASSYMHEHLADPEEEEATLPKWAEQLRGSCLGGQHDANPYDNNCSSTTASPFAAQQHRQHHHHQRLQSCSSDPTTLQAAAAVLGGSTQQLQQQQQQQPPPDAAPAGAAADEGAAGLRQPLLGAEAGDGGSSAGEGADAVMQMQQQQPPLPLAERCVSGVSGASAVTCTHHFASLTLMQALRTLQFWLLFGLFLVAVGSCLTFLNNLGQLNIALGGEPGEQVVFVSLFAVGNAGGRLLMGMLPESYLHSAGVPRTAWLLGATSALTGCMVAAAAASDAASLSLLSLLLGACYGATFSLIPAIAADVFGLKHFAAVYAGLQTACAAAGLIFPTRLVAFFYARALAEHGTGEPCIGQDCFGPTFVVEAVACLLGCACAGLVHASSRAVYAQLAQHLEEVECEQAQDMIEQWHAQQLVLHGAAARAPSDPTISGSTGMPVGRFGHSFHRQRGHANPRLNAAAAAAAAAAGDSGGSVPAGLLSQATG